ncbi:MAG: glutathione S-transferase family protein [Hyphomicrobiales bacterium]|nr:glutathione S-transferase family protein [Hyphomicrobiales bacterium]
MLKIYGRANSINVRKVLWAADEVGETYVREDWGRGYRPLNDPAFQALNPLGAVPVVDDDGFVLRESHVIVRYLADKFQRTDLYPDEKRTRFLIDAWMDWAGSDLYWGVRPVFLGQVVGQAPYTEPKLIEIAAAEWNRRMAQIDAHLSSSGPFIMGPMFTIADIPIGLVVNRWMSIVFEKPALPAVASYYERLTERPAYQLHGRNGTP